MSALEIILAVAGAVVALLLFGLEVHGRKMEHRSSRERIVIAALAVLGTAVLTTVVFLNRRTAIPGASQASADRDSATTTRSPSNTVSTTLTNDSSSQTSEPLAGTMQSSTETSGTSDPSTAEPLAPSIVETPEPYEIEAKAVTAQNGSLLRTPPTPTCEDAKTGHYAFKNVKADRDFSAVLDYDGDNEARRSILVPAGETQYFYDVAAGRHKYIVTYRAMVPIMTFPPGAPTMPQDVIYRQGEILVEQCQSGLIEIR